MSKSNQIPSPDQSPVQSTVAKDPVPRIIANDIYTEELLEQILWELKISNKHLQVISGERFTAADIRDETS